MKPCINIINLSKKDRWEWVIGFGFFFLVIIVGYQFLINSGLVEPIANQRIVYVYGILFVSISASINLARDFSKTQETLLNQEREAKEQEIKRRILESDNLRKTQELEEARKLQLSMLPEEIPQLPHLDIAVYMKTATEVGGDYYDFKVEEGDALTIVLGDATGHGTKAGIMVALIKNIFNSMGHTFFIPDFFKHTTKLIKQMKLGHLYMALMLLKMKKNQVLFSSAGMPPILIYRAQDNTIEEQVLKGLPLGGIESFSYEQQKFEVSPGDVMLMMTDGYAELFNKAFGTNEITVERISMMKY
jgi:serine phosphatase RsbU (regulator of sigma subunit)